MSRMSVKGTRCEDWPNNTRTIMLTGVARCGGGGRWALVSRLHSALWARVVLGSCLGVVLVVGGFGLMARTDRAAGSSEWFEAVLGVTGVMAGFVWFMIVVADRVCPMERRGWIDLLEGVVMIGVLAGLGWSAKLYLLGAHG